MKEGLHPQWYPEAQVTCACGESWTVGATVPEIRTDICSKCHPYYTGEQRIVDTEGQVDRFMRRLQAREEAIDEAEPPQSSPHFSRNPDFYPGVGQAPGKTAVRIRHGKGRTGPHPLGRELVTKV